MTGYGFVLLTVLVGILLHTSQEVELKAANTPNQDDFITKTELKEALSKLAQKQDENENRQSIKIETLKRELRLMPKRMPVIKETRRVQRTLTEMTRNVSDLEQRVQNMGDKYYSYNLGNSKGEGSSMAENNSKVCPAGPKGDRGPMGEQGPAGFNGTKGERGDKGAKGDKCKKEEQPLTTLWTLKPTTAAGSTGDTGGSSTLPTSTTTRSPSRSIESCSNYTFSENIPDKQYVIQHRRPWLHKASTMSMDRNWEAYKRGFCTSDELWAGLENIYQVVKSGTWNLRIEVTLQNGTRRWSLYHRFYIKNEAEKYKLYLSKSVKGNMQSKGLVDCWRSDEWEAVYNYFSTRDRDNDREDYKSLAWDMEGGWWYDQHYTALGLNTGYNYGSGDGREITYTDCELGHKWYLYLRETKMIIIRN